MSSVPERQRVDRELSSELIESPINPAFLHVSAPLKNDYQIFFLHINGEALWQWRGIKRRDQMFQVLQDNLFQIGYRLSSCCENRVGLTVYSRVNYVVNKVRNAANKGGRHAVRSAYWCSITLHPDEISKAPEDIIASLKEKQEELVRENQRLEKELEGKNNWVFLATTVHSFTISID